jgi:hypothetical protein
MKITVGEGAIRPRYFVIGELAVDTALALARLLRYFE